MNRQKDFVKNTFILAIGTFFPKFAVFITLPVLTAYLTQEEYGTYDLIITLVALLLPAATLQIQSAAFRFLIDIQNDEEEKKSVISNIYGFIVPISLVVLLILNLFLSGQPTNIRIGICLYFMFDIISNASKQIIRGLSKNRDYTISASISAVGQIVLIYILVFGLRCGLIGGIAALCCAEFLSGIFLIFRGKLYKYFSLKAISVSKLKELLNYSWPMVPNSLSQWVMNVSDRFVITIFMGVSANAIYAVAYKIPSILNFAQTTFNLAWQENATKTSLDDDVSFYYSTMFEWLFDIVAGFLAALIAITPILFKILIHGDYSAAYPQIPILYMGMLFFTLSSFWGGIFVAYKKSRTVGTTTVLAAILNLTIDLLLINRIGIYAASISTLVSYIALCIFRMVGVQRIIKLNYKVKHILVVLILLVVLCVLGAQRTTCFYVITFFSGMIFGVVLNLKTIKVFMKKLIEIAKNKSIRP